MLRTGEVLAIRTKDVLVDNKTHTAVISLGLTKGENGLGRLKVLRSQFLKSLGGRLSGRKLLQQVVC
jgi:hypothetical protein